MKPQELSEFMQQIPEYIRYVYPGGITIYLYAFFRGNSMKESRGVIIKSIALSYLYNVFIENILKVHQGTQAAFNVILICCGVIVAYISYQLINSKFLGEFLGEFDIATSTKSDELDLINSDQRYTYLRIYLKDKNMAYEGFLRHYEAEHTQNKFVILSQYKTIYWKSEETSFVSKCYEKDDHEWVIIYYDSIDRIEKRNVEKILN